MSKLISGAINMAVAGWGTAEYMRLYKTRQTMLSLEGIALSDSQESVGSVLEINQKYSTDNSDGIGGEGWYTSEGDFVKPGKYWATSVTVNTGINGTTIRTSVELLGELFTISKNINIESDKVFGIGRVSAPMSETWVKVTESGRNVYFMLEEGLIRHKLNVIVEYIEGVDPAA
jgi:hypothetical protein